MSDNVAVSAVLSSGRKSGSVITGLDDLDEDTKVAHFNTIKINIWNTKPLATELF